MVISVENDLALIRAPVEADMRAVDAFLVSALTSEVPFIQEAVDYILQSGGKRLRPLLLLLVAQACGYADDSQHHELAVVVEFIHTATLFHDDVIDQPEMRRGKKTANTLWGNEASILVGDFLYSRAFQILARRQNTAVMTVLAHATNQIAEGEISQLLNQHNPDITEEAYYEVIRRKTARLFSAAAEIAAIIASPDAAIHKSMANFGMHFGMAYQIIDDLLDYSPEALVMGKSVGNDLAEGKITLPLIFAKQRAQSHEINYINDAIRNNTPGHFSETMHIIKATHALDSTLAAAQAQVTLALDILQNLPSSVFRTALEALTKFVIHRNY